MAAKRDLDLPRALRKLDHFDFLLIDNWDIFLRETDDTTWGTVFSLLNSSVSNQQKWDILRPERSGVGWRSGELPEGPVVASSPFDRLRLHLLPAL